MRKNRGYMPKTKIVEVAEVRFWEKNENPKVFYYAQDKLKNKYKILVPKSMES